MNYKLMGRFIAQILAVEAAFMSPALALALWDKDYQVANSFLITIVLTLGCALALHLACKKTKAGFYAKEGLVCVGLSWIVMGVMGCLPFVISGAIPSFIDALFETVSGFTTTGASILTEIASLPRAILYWRSFTHWLGGMGVLVFLLAVAPGSGRKDGFSMHLLRAESPGPDVGKLVPRMRQTAMILYKLYILITVLNVVFLLLGGLPWFDSICTAFGTAGTGGFAIKNDSIAGYSPYIQNVCTVFMLLFGMNFTCYYLMLLRQFKTIFRDEEVRMYLGIVVASIALIAWNIRGMYDTLEETVRHAAFQVASIMTTTGFATTDFDLWPSFSKGILLCLMLIGACAGSTGGGFKCGRALLVFKGLKRNINQVINPQRIEVVRNNNHRVNERVLDNTNAYLAAYMCIMIVSFLVISLDGFSLTTNISAVVACFNNIGPGFEMVGATGNYSAFSGLSKVTLIIIMLAGRLEIFPILALLSYKTWKN
ncbi:TrkH family potassium uptake protein [Bengtsoniella intestinalis]|uniref:TrkH family potassium uptake protein n=1 Tax=Bengtsoniella intestinalis TaxID=3073143 RepID=UPI00391F50F3